MRSDALAPHVGVLSSQMAAVPPLLSASSHHDSLSSTRHLRRIHTPPERVESGGSPECDAHETQTTGHGEVSSAFDLAPAGVALNSCLPIQIA
ncbi:hypothetical protein AAFF_G00405040 [Aldrovandia affinis]|uniref:Uncharacterized protein n=1 Tax=Aldrovandia affinis TaxID=143900 RepID=A0AAD7X0F9_9TELE|nr:hypothetical protein AAFF_G00405040 [Aldrovandia affinis]